MTGALIECVVNVSEGRDDTVLGELASACGPALLDLHADAGHHRSVFTLGGDVDTVREAAHRLTEAAVMRLRLQGHDGRHPRFGVVDVVPFVSLVPWPGRLPEGPGPLELSERHRFARWAADQLGLPAFLYGPLGESVRTLPEVRRRAFAELRPDVGPPTPHPTAGAVAVGARGPLVAYNLWVAGAGSQVVRDVARRLRRPEVRALGFELPNGLQVSCNLVEPLAAGPTEVADEVSAMLAPYGARIERAELVGLLPEAVLRRVPRPRRRELGLSEDATIEARLGAAGSAAPRGRV